MTLPAEVPDDGPRLRDWYQFHAVVLPMRADRPRVQVLLPVPVGESEQVDHEARRALAERVVSLQKPAHTVFDVRFFWSAFRVGEARLGLDTLIDLGSRSPALLDAARARRRLPRRERPRRDARAPAHPTAVRRTATPGLMTPTCEETP